MPLQPKAGSTIAMRTCPTCKKETIHQDFYTDEFVEPVATSCLDCGVTRALPRRDDLKQRVRETRLQEKARRLVSVAGTHTTEEMRQQALRFLREEGEKYRTISS
jgi:hypothetical protein